MDKANRNISHEGQIASFVSTALRTSIAILDVVAALIFTFAFLVQLLALIMRDIFNTGFAEQTEIGALAIIVICFLGMVEGFSRNGHVRFDLCEKKLKGKASLALALFSLLITAVTLAAVAYLSMDATIRYSQLYLRTLSMPWLPLWPFMAVVAVGCLFGVGGIFLAVRKRLSP